MHSYLVVGKAKDKLDKKIESIISNLGASAQKFSLSKIDDLRALSSLSKYRFNDPVTFVIEDIDYATSEAQSAFLKNLEEPNDNISYILTAESELKVLPTIVSRCLVHRVATYRNLSKKDISKVKRFLEMTSSEKLLSLSKQKNRDDAKALLEDIALGGHGLLLEKTQDFLKISKFIKSTMQTIGALRANGNVALQLTNFVVNLD